MALRDSTHTRLVAWLKIVLPLAALGLLSTLFLLSKSATTQPEIPFSEVELRDRLRQQQITAPNFSGTSPSGARLSLRAASARPDPEFEGRASARDVEARIGLTSGTEIVMRALEAELDDNTGQARLLGNVSVTSSTGYEVRASGIVGAIGRIEAESLGEVRGSGPPGQFTAGQMVLATDPDSGEVQLLFTRGVSLVYDPAK